MLVTCFFPDVGLQIETDFVTSPLHATGRKYDVIIGMLVLRRYRLVMDGINNDYRLEFK